LTFEAGGYLRAQVERREKRFILYARALEAVEGVVAQGEAVVAHINDPGRLPILQPGAQVWLRGPYLPPAKLAWRAKLLRLAPPHAGRWISLDTALANAVAAAAAAAGLLPGVPAEVPLREVRRGDSRFDLVWPLPDGGEHVAEAKTVSMIRAGGWAPWPDAPSARGHKHLQHLMALAASGRAASLVFVTYHPDARAICPAADIDPAFAALLGQAEAAGVRLVGYRAVAHPEGIDAGEVLPVRARGEG
jgi:sugar fermentation stimulation protein A